MEQFTQNRRRYERKPFFRPVRLTILPDEADVSANTFDISIGGIGAISDVWLERGTNLRVRFTLKDKQSGQCIEDVLGRVAYTRADESGNHIGVEFLKIIDESTHPALFKAMNRR